MLVSIVCGLAMLVVGLAEYPSEPYRLPTSIKPLHYNLSIISYLTNPYTFWFEGDEWIKIKCMEATTTIILHSKKLRISMRKVRLTDTDLNDISIYEKYLVPQYDFFVINTQPLLRGKVYILFIPFVGYLDEKLTGYYFGSYYPSREDMFQSCFAVTQFEPTYARTAFPCFDEPAMKAVFQINLGHHVQFEAVSNMHMIASIDMPDQPDYVWDKFNETLSMSTYLVAFFLTDFEHVSMGNSSNCVVPMDLWCQYEAVNQSLFARQVGPDILKFYEKYLGVPYLLPKLDMVAIPEFNAEAMENWGLITFRESTLLFKENTSSLYDKIRVASVISHEIAHQWFGNMVTMSWWTDLWISEGFATYMAMLSMDEIHPEWQYYAYGVVESLLEVFAMDALQSSHPISVEIDNPSEIGEIFDTISFKKGALVLRMLSMVITEDVFRKATSSYLRGNALASVHQDVLWAWLTEEAYRQRSLSPEMSTKSIMDSWTLQPGYPLITVIRNYDSGTAVVSQSRYFSSDPTSETAIPQCWSVPLSYTTQTDMYFLDEMPKAWLSCDKPSTIVHLPHSNDDWVIFNLRMSGLYKVQYDEHNWQLLLAALRSENGTKIDPLNRFQLVNDVFDLAFIGELNYYTAFQFLQYLPAEQEFLPWRAAFSKLEYLYNILRHTSTARLYLKFARKILRPVYVSVYNQEGVGFVFGEQSIQNVKFRELLMEWACRLGFNKCVWEANHSLKVWMEMDDPDSNNPVIPEMRMVVFCDAMKRGSVIEWDFIYRRYLNSTVATEKDTLLNILGCITSRDVLIGYLSWSMAPGYGMRYQDTTQIFRSVALSSPVGFDVAKNFLMKNIEDIYCHYGGHAGSKISVYLKTLAERIFSSEDAQDFNDFIAENQKYLTESTLGLKQALETIQMNILWLQRNYKSITDVLTNLTSTRTEEVFSFLE